MMPTWLLAVLGLVLSVYAVYVEHKVNRAHEDPSLDFTALCDIEAIGASCSAVFQRPESKLLSHFGLVPEGHTLDVANAVLGTLYYIILLLAPPLLRHLSPSAADDFSTFLRLMTTAAFTTTVYLLYALTFVIYDLCVLCMTCHVINATLMYRIVWRGDRLSASKTTTAAKAD